MLRGLFNRVPRLRFCGVPRWWRNWRQPAPLGQRGERAAARYLRRKGYRIVFLAGPASQNELDIVAVDGRTVVFVEVKTRRSHLSGHPAAAVDRTKQRRLTQLALAYMKRHGLLECSARFDVIAVTWPDDRRQPTIEHFIAAFMAEGPAQMFG